MLMTIEPGRTAAWPNKTVGNLDFGLALGAGYSNSRSPRQQLQSAAAPFLPIAVNARLLRLGNINAVEPDALTGDLDSVSVDDTGLACEVGGVGGERQEQ